MKNLFSSLGIELLIAGCASPKVEPMQTSDGKQGFVVSMVSLRARHRGPFGTRAMPLPVSGRSGSTNL